MKAKSLIRMLVALSFAAHALAPTHAEDLPGLWKRELRGEYNSKKSALALEYCIGNAVSDWGSPHVLHGEGVTDLWIGAPYAIRINDNGDSRAVKFTASKTYDDRVGLAIGGCL